MKFDHLPTDRQYLSQGLVMCLCYEITNIVNKRSYIGCTTDPIRRMANHLFLLRANKHYSEKMQADFNEFGESSFAVTAIKVFTVPYIGAVWYEAKKLGLAFERNLIKERAPYYNPSVKAIAA